MAGPFKLDNQYANYVGHWAANTAYATGKRVIAESANAGDARKYVFEATTGGTSADPGPPTWVTTPGNTTSDGTVTWTCREATTWANAHGKIAWICLVPAAGEILHIDDGHSESVSVSETWTFNGTIDNKVRVICVDKATDNAVSDYPASALYTSGIVYDLDLAGSAYFWGVNFSIGDDVSVAIAQQFIFENSKFILNGPDSVLKIKEFTGGLLTLINSDFGFVNAGGYIYLDGDADGFFWRGGVLTGNPTSFIKTYGTKGQGLRIDIHGVDFSTMVGGILINNTISGAVIDAMISGIKLNATPPTLLGGSALGIQSHILMDIADSGNTVFKFRREYRYGYAQDESTKVITGKALYDGTNEFTVKMVSRATPTPTFYDPWRYHLTTLREKGFAANRTYTVHIAQDHASVQPAALNNDEIWLEVVYPDDSTAKFNIANDKIATPTTTPAAQTTSTESWEGLAATTRLQELAVTIASADGKNGPVEIWICLAKESKTVYVCPEVYVS